MSINKSAKLRRVRKEKNYHTPEGELQKLHHLVISPNLGWYFDLASSGRTLEEAQKITKTVVKRILDEMRAQGVLIRHSFRGKNDDGSIKSESDDRGAWKERLNSGRKWNGDVRNELAWKPHYHCIVASDWLEGGELTERVEKETGWVIHRIADDNGISLGSDGAMARAMTYCLSHCDIQIREDSHNRSAVWEVGSFEGDPIKSSSRFSPSPVDLEWADRVVRRAAVDTLGLQSGTTDCGARIPPVDDPDELARQIIEELYPQQERPAHRDIDPDTLLYHVSEGNLSVDISTTSGGGGNVTVKDAFGEPIGPSGWGSNLPEAPSDHSYSGADEPIAQAIVGDDEDVDCDCGHDHNTDDNSNPECGGTLIPLEEARQRGLFDDPDWVRDAAHVDEAREINREWPDDLDPWRTSSPGNLIGAG
ncbi:hypothetical protein [Halorhabdus salina]|uniref:hypothetical protein n=1 Tax=Halorhabdus salina TaxID=2750670 RepID=UPI0015EFD1BA|nr:hypothetical protein [Halorhabdus salina]